MKSRFSVLALVIVSAGALSAFGGTPRTSLPGGLAGKSSAAIVKQAVAAVITSESATFSLAETYQSYRGYAVLQTSTKHATGAIHSFTGIGKFAQLGNKIYIQGDAAQLSRTFGKPTKTVKPYVGKWINIPKSSKHYKAASTGNLLPSSLSQQVPIGPYKLGGVHKIAGVRMLEVIGKLNPQGSGVNGNAYMFVSLKAPYYPLFIVQSAKINGYLLTVTIKLAKFGVAFKVVAPAHFITSTSTKLG